MVFGLAHQPISLVRKDLQVHKALKVLLGLQVHKALKDQQAQLDRKVLKV
jgi:hypothetical protein